MMQLSSDRPLGPTKGIALVQRVLLSLVLFFSAVVLVFGWGAGIESLVRLGADRPGIVPTTAFGLYLVSGAHLLHSFWQGMKMRIVLAGASTFVALFALINLVGMMSGAMPNGFDGNVWPGTLGKPFDAMSIPTSINFVFAGFAGILLARRDRSRRMLFHIMLTIGLMLSLAVLLTYVLDPYSFRHVAPKAAMSAQTALAFAVLFPTIILFDSHGGWVDLLTGDNVGSANARLLLPIFVLMPFLLAFSGLILTQEGVISTSMRLSIMTILGIAIGAAAVLHSAVRINRLDAEQLAMLDQLRRTSDEKETLLREIYHRVKNNLQRIDAMLAFESAQVPDKRLRDAFGAMSGRVRALAVVHELLLRSATLSRIDISDYLMRLTDEIANSQGLDQRGIKIMCNVQPLEIDFEVANTLGLLVNELVSNAVEHAFPFGTNGQIRVELQAMSENTCRLVVADNGVNNSDYDPACASRGGIGSRIIRSLARQLGGDLTVNKSMGTRVTLSFPCVAAVWSFSV